MRSSWRDRGTADLPPDANTLLSEMDHWLRSRNYVNVIVAGKQLEAQRHAALSRRHGHQELGQQRPGLPEILNWRWGQ